MKIFKITFLLFFFLSISCKKDETSEPKSSAPQPVSIATEKTENLTQQSADSSDSNSHKIKVQKISTKKIIQNKSDTYSIYDFLEKTVKPAQVFTISSDKDTIILCAEKTKINFYANSFIFEKSKQEVKENIKITITEYYKISDIILANLSTTSNAKLIETAGMLHISASSAGENCILKSDKSIAISFPSKEYKENMQLFTGNFKDKNINWTLENNTDQETYYDAVSPNFPGGQVALRQFINQNVKIPNISGNRKIRLLARFTINTLGEVKNPVITKGYNPQFDAAVLKAIALLPNFSPAKNNSGLPIESNYNLPVLLEIKSDELFFDYVDYVSKDSIKSTRETMQELDTNSDKPKSVEYYLFHSSKLGWINCDRFLNFSRDLLTKFRIDSKTANSANIRIVFHDIKAILSSHSFRGKNIFENVPLNSKVTVFVTTLIDGKPHLAVKESVISRETVTNFDFKPISIEMLDAEALKLNNILP